MTIYHSIAVDLDLDLAPNHFTEAHNKFYSFLVEPKVFGYKSCVCRQIHIVYSLQFGTILMH
jgi:hypothetical protein